MGRIRQAGAVTVRGTLPHAEVLVVRAKKNPSHWIFPKGHIEAGESAEDAALRELREEAGVAGDVVGPAGSSQFASGNEDVSIDYFIVRFTGTPEDGDGRETRWVTLDEAGRLLTFRDAREHLAAARETLSEAET